MSSKELPAHIHDSSIFNITTPEFFINMKSYPDVDSVEREAFVQEELRKCRDGVTINGVFIPPTLYYDLNYHKIQYDEVDGRSIGRPMLRDNGWIIHNDIYQAKTEKKHYCIAGSRQISKSDTLTSLCMRQIFVYENTEALLLFGSSADKDTFTKKAKIAVDNCQDFMVVPNLDEDWTKKTIRFGFKESDNKDYIHALLFLYLTEEGVNTQAGAGKSLTFFAYDEIAKFPFKKSWNSVKFAFEGDYGFRNVGFFSFTGGEVEKSKDAEQFFLNPVANNLLAFETEGKKTGRFMGGWYRGMFKESVKFSEYIKKTQGIEVPPGSELDTMEILATNFEKADKELDAREQALLEAGLIKDYNDERIFHPRSINHMFLKQADNPFSIFFKEFEKLLEYLEDNPPHFVDFDSTNQIIQGKKPPFFQYPIARNDFDRLDSCVCMTDKPRLIRGKKLYVAGCDPFNTVKTAESPSLGSWYIMRVRTSDYDDPYARRMTMWYNGRKDISHFRKTLTSALVAHGAEDGCITLLHEAADDNLTQHYTEQNKGYYLEDTYNLSREINEKANSFNTKGLRATLRNQEYYLQAIMEYLEEDMGDGKLGLWRISDPYLIRQLMAFDGDLSDKDAIVAFGHALVHLNKERRYTIRVTKQEIQKPVVKNTSAFGRDVRKYGTRKSATGRSAI